MTPDYQAMAIRTMHSDDITTSILYMQEQMSMHRGEPEEQRAAGYKAKLVAEMRRRNGATA